MIWLPFPEPKPPSGTVETMFEVGLSLIRGWWLRDRPTFLCWLWDVFCLDLKLFKKKLGISIQCSVNQYLGTVKYQFILQILILYFFIGNIQISILMSSIKKYLLIYWYFQYFSVSLWKHSKIFVYWNVTKVFCLFYPLKRTTAHHTMLGCFCYCLIFEWHGHACLLLLICSLQIITI